MVQKHLALINELKDPYQVCLQQSFSATQRANEVCRPGISRLMWEARGTRHPTADCLRMGQSEQRCARINDKDWKVRGSLPRCCPGLGVGKQDRIALPCSGRSTSQRAHLLQSSLESVSIGIPLHYTATTFVPWLAFLLLWPRISSNIASTDDLKTGVCPRSNGYLLTQNVDGFTLASLHVYLCGRHFLTGINQPWLIESTQERAQQLAHRRLPTISRHFHCKFLVTLTK